MTDLFLKTAADRRADRDRCLVTLAQRQAAAPLKPKVPQEPLDIGRFGEQGQADLVDAVALFRSEKLLGADDIDALEGLRLEALTMHLDASGREAVGEDSVEFFERA